MTTPKAIRGAGGIDLVLNDQFYPKRGRRPYMDNFALPMGCQKLPSMSSGFGAHPQPLCQLVSAQAEVGKRKAKLKRRKDTNLLLGHSAPLSGITLCCCVRTDIPQHMWVQTLLHGHLPPLLPPHRRYPQSHRKGELSVPYIQPSPRGLRGRGAAGIAS